MIRKVNELSPEQRVVSEQISLRRVLSSPDWLKDVQRVAAEKGLDRLTMEEVEAEIAGARRERRAKDQGTGYERI